MRTLLILLIPFMLSGQKYLVDGMQWEQSDWYWNDGFLVNYVYKISGDTVLEGENYKKVFLNVELMDRDWETGSINHREELNSPEGYLRQIGNCIYRRNDGGQAHLLECFDYEIGDSTYDQTNLYKNPVIIDSIGEYFNGLENLKVFYTKDKRSILYEGIGWSGGLLKNPLFYEDPGFDMHLHCWSWKHGKQDFQNQRDSIYDKVKLIATCNEPVKTQEKEEKRILIYPNPSTGKIWIDGDRKGDIEVYNVQGVKVKEIEKEESSMNLNKGVYMLRMVSRHEIRSDILIVK